MKDKHFVYDKVVGILRARSPGGRVLDAAAGEGLFSEPLKAAGYDVTPVDIDPSRLEARGWKATKADLNQPLPFGAGEFDFVVSSETIEHLENPFQFVRECHRVLKPGGTLVLTTPNVMDLNSRLSFTLVGMRSTGSSPLDERAPSGYHHQNLMTFFELRYALMSAGFSIEAIDTTVLTAARYWFFWLVPLMKWMTRGSIKAANRPMDGLYEQVFSKAVLYGKKLIITARRP